MIILINQEVFDVGDPWETLTVGLGREMRTPPPLAQIVRMGQDIAFGAGCFEKASAENKSAVAALMGVAGQANCALFIVPQRARSARDVAVRLGNAPLTTMALLLSLHVSGKLTASHINHYVWVAPGSSAA